jgi:hypothetical protein
MFPKGIVEAKASNASMLIAMRTMALSRHRPDERQGRSIAEQRGDRRDGSLDFAAIL